MKQYTTKSNDTINKIAGTFYGDPAKSVLITDVNQFQINVGNDDVLPVGTVLIIPTDSTLENLRREQLRRGLGG